MSPTTRRRELRRVRRARGRAAHHASLLRAASTPAERLRVAADALLSEVRHGVNPDRPPADVVSDIAEQAALVVGRAELSPVSRALYETKLAQPGSERQRAGTALMCLRAAIDRLPESDAERDRVREHYVGELTREAGRLRAGR